MSDRDKQQPPEVLGVVQDHATGRYYDVVDVPGARDVYDAMFRTESADEADEMLETLTKLRALRHESK